MCRAFLVPKPNKENSWRLVIDLRPINRFCHAPSTRFETLKRLRTLAQPDDWLVSFDLQDGFYAVGVHPADRRYLQFQIGDRLFQFAALPMGWNASPGLFCQVMNAWTKFLRSPQRRDKVFRRLPRDQQDHLAQLRTALGERDWARGLRMLPYMDDFLIMSEDREAALRRREAVRDLLSRLGLRRHPDKGIWEPTRCLEHLGLEIDTHDGVFRVSEARQAKLRRAAKELEVLSCQRRRQVPARKVAGFVGLAQSVYLAVPAARYFLRALHDALSTKSSWNDKVKIDHQARRDLQWWSQFGLEPKQNGRGIWQSPDTAVLHCDASDIGWGGVLNHQQPARGFWQAHQRGLHITLKELKAVRLTVETFLSQLRGRRVLLWEDNMAVKHILTNLTTKSPEMMRELRKLWYLLDTNDITLRARYIRSASNVWADRLSREIDSNDWMFNPHIFAYLDGLWGPHTTDRFATSNNTQLARYNSPTWDPRSSGVDAMAQSDSDWRHENNWINPPWALLEDVVTKLRNSGGAATVLAPHWPDSIAYQLLQNMASDIIDLSPHRELFFPGRLGSYAGVGRSAWSVTAFRIPGRPAGRTPIYGGGHRPPSRRHVNPYHLLPAPGHNDPRGVATRYDYRKAGTHSAYHGEPSWTKPTGQP